MSVRSRRLVLWIPLVVLLLAGLGYAFAPRPVAVDVGRATRGPLLVTVDAEGKTRIHDVFTLSAPITARVGRIELEPGDTVLADHTVVARLEPADPAFLDVRTEAELDAAIHAAEAAMKLAKAELERARAEQDYAATEVDRARTLAARGIIPRRELDAAERGWRARQAEVASAKAALDVRTFELERARAQSVATSQMIGKRNGCDCVTLTAPVDGEILQVYHRSEGVVAAGDPLVDIGDPNDLEIVSDVLSQDAVRVRTGQRVIVENWGGPEPLDGIVTRVEPWGFTKVSALGIEEQRVNVIITLTDRRHTYAALGHGFQVDVRIVVSEGRDVLSVPLTALFRDDGGWAAFAIRDGRAVLAPVEIGRSDGIRTEILGGLSEGDAVVLYPTDRVRDGVSVTRR